MTTSCSVQDWPYANFSTAPRTAHGTCPATVQSPVGGADYAKLLDGIQLVLDGVGLIPGFGEVADGLNAFISGCRGDYVGAALSIVCMVPVAGYLGNAMKAGRHLSPNGMITMLRGLGEPALRAIADASDQLIDFLAGLPGKLSGVLRRLRRWGAISEETYRMVERALDPVMRGIDEAFAQVMGQIDEALNGPPGAFAMAGGAPAPTRPQPVSMASGRPSGGGSPGGRAFKQGDHLVNTGLTKVLDELRLLDGQGRAMIEQARRMLDDPSFLATISKGAHGADANSVAFGRAAQRVRDAAREYQRAQGAGQVAARALSLRVELRDMLKAAIDVEVADQLDPRRVGQVREKLVSVWAILDGAVARSTHAAGLRRH